MSNYAYVHCKDKVTNDLIYDYLKQANKLYFHNFMIIQKPTNKDETFLCEFSEAIYGLQLWKKSYKTIIVRHQSGMFIWWVDYIIRNYLAYRFNGYITDDGCDGKEEPDFKYVKFDDYAKLFYAPSYLKYSKCKILIKKYFFYKLVKNSLNKEVYNKLCLNK